MKNIIAILILSFSFQAFAAESAGSEDEREAEKAEQALRQQINYFFGYHWGKDLKDTTGIEADLHSLMEGVRDALEGRPPAMSQQEQEAVVAAIREKRETMLAKERDEAARRGKENLQAGLEFLAENADKKGVKETDTGLQILEVESGKGQSPLASDTVLVHYEGRLISGEVFDTSYSRNEPVEFGLHQVIPGWTEGLQLMKVGGTYRLFVPSELAYGPRGTGSIPANSVLIFDVELLEIK